jgi:hypothetical protein
MMHRKGSGRSAKPRPAQNRVILSPPFTVDGKGQKILIPAIDKLVSLSSPLHLNQAGTNRTVELVETLLENLCVQLTKRPRAKRMIYEQGEPFQADPITASLRKHHDRHVGVAIREVWRGDHADPKVGEVVQSRNGELAERMLPGSLGDLLDSWCRSAPAKSAPHLWVKGQPVEKGYVLNGERPKPRLSAFK